MSESICNPCNLENTYVQNMQKLHIIRKTRFQKKKRIGTRLEQALCKTGCQNGE